MFTRFILLVSAFFFSGISSSASFDCGLATNYVEHEICDNNALSSADMKMAALYKNTLTVYPAIKIDQRTWLKEYRNKCQTNECLTNEYSRRINYLGTILNLASTNKSTEKADDNSEVITEITKPESFIQSLASVGNNRSGKRFSDWFTIKKTDPITDAITHYSWSSEATISLLESAHLGISCNVDRNGVIAADFVVLKEFLAGNPKRVIIRVDSKQPQHFNANSLSADNDELVYFNQPIESGAGQKLVQSMMAGSNAVIRLEYKYSDRTDFSVSLKGFTASLQKALSNCSKDSGLTATVAKSTR